MKRETQTVWTSDSGTTLLTKKGSDFYVPVSTVTPEILRELGKAIDDALSDELIQAMNTVKNGGNK